MSRQFLARILLTTKPANYISHEGKICTERAAELPIGTPIAIDALGDVFIPAPVHADLFRNTKASKDMRRLFRDYWVYAHVNVDEPSKAGPYHHAILNALGLPLTDSIVA